MAISATISACLICVQPARQEYKIISAVDQFVYIDCINDSKSALMEYDKLQYTYN
jgi:hypothetical protein